MAEELDYDPEFPLRTSRLKQASNQYYNIEHYFMPTDDYSQCPRKMQCRNYAIRTILKYTQGAGYKAYIPYIALNYFDRFFSKIPLPDSVERDEVNTRVTAIACLIMAFKLCIKNFSVESFLTRHEDIETPQQNLRSEEFNILKALVWRACAVTPFCFLNTNYPRFRDLGGFSRRSIHQIIVASLADHGFTKYKPSLIALSSFLAAAHILYGPERLKVAENEVTTCFHEMIELCIRKKIKIEPASVINIGKRSDEESDLNSWTKNCTTNVRPDGPDRDWDFDVQWLPAETC